MATMTAVGQYGLQKTTMSDIAKAAGISRQTLYNAYPNKEEVLQAAVKHFMEHDLQNVRDAWEAMDGFEAKLDAYFKFGPIHWYDSIQDMPNSSELMEGISKIVEPTLRDAHNDWVDLLAELLSGTMDSTQAQEVADFVFLSAKNAKYSASDREQLLRRLALLKEMVVKTYLR